MPFREKISDPMLKEPVEPNLIDFYSGRATFRFLPYYLIKILNKIPAVPKVLNLNPGSHGTRVPEVASGWDFFGIRNSRNTGDRERDLKIGINFFGISRNPDAVAPKS